MGGGGDVGRGAGDARHLAGAGLDDRLDEEIVGSSGPALRVSDSPTDSLPTTTAV